jgi:hypothetical protein
MTITVNGTPFTAFQPDEKVGVWNNGLNRGYENDKCHAYKINGNREKYKFRYSKNYCAKT